MNARLLAWHRALAPLAGVVVLLWGLSGLLHPLMRLTAPALAAFHPPARAFAGLEEVRLDLWTELAKRGIREVRSLRLARLGERVAVRIEPGPLYLDAATGETIEAGARLHAESLARYYTGEGDAAVASVEPVTAFDREYPTIQRLLPVERVTFARADGLRVYVDLATDALGAAVDDRRARLLRAFAAVHTWSFAGPNARFAIATLMLASALVVALGVALFLRTRAPRVRLRRVHRLLGAFFALTLLSFPLSGAVHALHGPGAPPPPERVEAAFPVVALGWLPNSGLGVSLAWLDGRPHWRVVRESGVDWLDAKTGARTEDGELRRARELASGYAALPEAEIAATELVARYTDEYGFIRKRLPVVRVAFRDPDVPLFFVDPATGVLAARVSRADLREQWIFNEIHKWSFADPLGMNGRDALVASAVLGNAAVAALGLALWLSARRARASSARRAPRRSQRS
jgi:hypothetical protein